MRLYATVTMIVFNTTFLSSQHVLLFFSLSILHGFVFYDNYYILRYTCK